MRVAILTTDNRENYRHYELARPYFGTAPEALLQGFATDPEVEVHVVSCAQHAMQSPDKLADNTWFHSLLVPKIGWLRTGYQGCIRAARRKLKQIQPDIVHGQGTERECAISAIFSGFPNLITIHGNMRLIAKVNRAKPFSYQWLSARLERFTAPQADGVICISRYTQDAVVDLARKTWVVPNAVDQMFFDNKRSAQSEPTILCVGDIMLRKNQNEFIRALDPLAQRIKFNLIFFGRSSPKDAYCLEFFDLIRNRPWCKYAEFADRRALLEQFKMATLLAMPSLEENCPMALLEAMAAGVPVVAAKVGGIPELVEENVSGTFCDPTDPESMRNAVARTLENSEQAQSMAERAKFSAQERYHPEIIAKRHLEIYREVLGSKP